MREGMRGKKEIRTGKGDEEKSIGRGRRERKEM